ncbi:MAG: hypothetical protein HY782_22970 [Chloroflexi bacterium]|nr:hypothetical protein [Chloroflexota bacterium]
MDRATIDRGPTLHPSAYPNEVGRHVAPPTLPAVKLVPTNLTVFLLICYSVGLLLLPFGIGAIPLGIALIGTLFNWGKWYRR